MMFMNDNLWEMPDVIVRAVQEEMLMRARNNEQYCDLCESMVAHTPGLNTGANTTDIYHLANLYLRALMLKEADKQYITAMIDDIQDDADLSDHIDWREVKYNILRKCNFKERSTIDGEKLERFETKLNEDDKYDSWDLSMLSLAELTSMVRRTQWFAYEFGREDDAKISDIFC